MVEPLGGERGFRARRQIRPEGGERGASARPGQRQRRPETECGKSEIAVKLTSTYLVACAGCYRIDEAVVWVAPVVAPSFAFVVLFYCEGRSEIRPPKGEARARAAPCQNIPPSASAHDTRRVVM